MVLCELSATKHHLTSIIGPVTNTKQPRGTIAAAASSFPSSLIFVLALFYIRSRCVSAGSDKRGVLKHLKLCYDFSVEE